MARWTVEARTPRSLAARDFTVSLLAGILLFPATGAEIVCMTVFLAGGMVGFAGLYLHRLHVVMVGLALAIIGAGCQVFTIPNWHRHSLLNALAWAFVGITAFLDFLAVSARGIE